MRNALAASSASGEHVYGWRARVCRRARCWATHQCPQPDQITAMTANAAVIAELITVARPDAPPSAMENRNPNPTITPVPNDATNVSHGDMGGAMPPPHCVQNRAFGAFVAPQPRHSRSRDISPSRPSTAAAMSKPREPQHDECCCDSKDDRGFDLGVDIC